MKFLKHVLIYIICTMTSLLLIIFLKSVGSSQDELIALTLGTAIYAHIRMDLGKNETG